MFCKTIGSLRNFVNHEMFKNYVMDFPLRLNFIACLKTLPFRHKYEYASWEFILYTVSVSCKHSLDMLQITPTDSTFQVHLNPRDDFIDCNLAPLMRRLLHSMHYFTHSVINRVDRRHKR